MYMFILCQICVYSYALCFILYLFDILSGADTCAVGYARNSYLCGECDDGYAMSSAFRGCVPCEKPNPFVWLVFCVGALLFVWRLFVIKGKTNYVIFAIMINHLQVDLSLFAATAVAAVVVVACRCAHVHMHCMYCVYDVCASLSFTLSSLSFVLSLSHSLVGIYYTYL